MPSSYPSHCQIFLLSSCLATNVLTAAGASVEVATSPDPVLLQPLPHPPSSPVDAGADRNGQQRHLLTCSCYV